MFIPMPALIICIITIVAAIILFCLSVFVKPKKDDKYKYLHGQRVKPIEEVERDLDKFADKKFGV